MKALRLAALVAVAPLAGCGAYYNDFDIINGTKAEIRDLSVSDGQNSWKLGNLKPGAKSNFYDHLAGEGGATISWTVNGKRFSAEGCYYTEGSATHGSMTIVGDHLDYRCT